MDIADVKNKSFIVRGTARDKLSDKPEKNQKKLDKGLAKRFKKILPTPGAGVMQPIQISAGKQPFLET